MPFKLLIVLISGVLLCQGCHTPPEPLFREASVKSGLPGAQNSVAAAMIGHYLALKNALVEAKPAAADSSARLLQAAIARLRAAADTTGEGNPYPKLTTVLDSMALQTNAILNRSDNSCEPQRICFKYLSDQMLAFIRETQVRGLNLYSQYCPMALNETGGWWLSTSAAVRNPYFGNKMLTCGEVVDTLR